MISLITCSIDPNRFNAISSMYSAAMGSEPWEMIGIHDAKSLCEGYNRGIAAARGDILVFTHDDIELLNAGLPQRIKSHLGKYDLIGVAGTRRVVGGSWIMAGAPYIFGQMAHANPNSIAVDIYGAPKPLIGGIRALDGVFMAARRTVAQRVRFDEKTFDGFHCYDVDFSLAVATAGMRVGVACDINFLHYSHGKYDDNWRMYAMRFEQKWLPGGSPWPIRPIAWSSVQVNTRAEAAELMNPPYWQDRD